MKPCQTRLGTLTQKAGNLAKGVTHEDCAEVKLLDVRGSEQKPDSPNDGSRGRTEGYTAHRLSIQGKETAQGYGTYRGLMKRENGNDKGLESAT
ncbi:MAG TPA: hypothetical protein VFT51_15815 [Bacillales bacterium]|nr:hypothetical protein [Bacillales bacterium]